MNRSDVMRLAFKDEMEKIAGATRLGKIPISPSNLASKGSNMWQKVKKAGAEKATKPFLNGKGPLIGAGMLGGAGVYHVARKANEDRRMGRAMRLQSMGQ